MSERARQDGEFSVVELRQYQLRPGRRDELIRLFEREFVESQVALGIRLFGLFCDASRPDWFIWLRGFHDMSSRREALEQFYGGPVWNAHGRSANATMIDSDNVLLLRPAEPGSGFDPAVAEVAAPLFCLIFPHDSASQSQAHAQEFLNRNRVRMTAQGGVVLAVYVTELSANTFPRLPVRQGENVLVTLVAGVRSRELASLASEASQTIELVPTKRSRLQLSPGGRPT
jgi:NIPSNAP